MGASQYARPNAAMRAMLGALLAPQEKRALVAAPSLEDAMRRLRATPYGRDLAVAEAGGELLPLEKALQRTLVGTYGRLIRTLEGAPRDLVEELLRHFEVDDIKAILRGLATGAPAAKIRALLVPLGRWERLPLERLLAAPSVAEAVRALGRLPYARPLGEALPRYEAERSLFPLEVALDLDYFRRLWARLEALSGGDRVGAVRILGARYDVLNVTWLLRYKLTYRLSAQEIFNYTLPHGYRVDDGVIRRATTAGDLAGLIAALPQPYRGLLAPLEGASLAHMEAALCRYLWHDARALLAGYPFQAGAILAYLHLKEAEVHDLVAILAGKRSGRPAAEIEALLWSEL
ncbi:MAG TPA: V-type ATPase subunit [Anaerolineae bacterium]|nr:V-type ATPase subunit [Anaerolineae bacterium]HOQ99341.1 V-type ATPase subunit [Anaerolineae bacterium]HPL26778.1 V-type ATPase subunit [Anaerolineae bacterium]